jgi:hypothetical protein
MDNLCCFYCDYLPYLNVAGSAVYDINVHISSAASLIGMACDTDITPGSPPRQQQIGLRKNGHG